jgi:hypothetical protein
MTSIIKVDQIQLADGTAPTAADLGFAAGSVLQVISAKHSTSTTTTSSSTFADTGLTATITPKYSNSKIAVMATVMGCENNTASNGISVRLMRDSTQLSEFAKYSGYTRTYITNHPAINYLDSPATTSAVVYKLQFKNSTGSGTANVQANSSESTIILMEIAG